jgi:hypothetical protein
MTNRLEFPVSRYGSYLATRGKAREMRSELDEHVRSNPDCSAVVVNFDGVEAMTISVADEFLGRFILDRSTDPAAAFGVLVIGLNEETLEAVTVCLERRGLAVAAIVCGKLRLVAAPEYLVESFKAAVTLGSFRASALAAKLNVSLPNANNRLKRLAALGALHKQRVAPTERGGKEYLYTAPDTKALAVA